jgi:agmatine deiminase
MKQLIWILFVFCFTGITVHGAEWRFPGEFEEQEAVWVGWISKEYIKGYPTDEVMVEIVKNLAGP